MEKKPYRDFRKKLFDWLAWHLSKQELHKGILKVRDDIDQIYKFSNAYIGRGYYSCLHSYQVQSEIRQLGELVQETNPKTILEIGTLKGGTLFLWCRSNPNAKLVISIDLPDGQYGGGYIKKREKLLREFIFDKPETKMHLIRANSHSNMTFDEVVNILDGKNLDFLFIDGDHTYEGVKQDFDMYVPFVKSGIVAFHDIAHYGDNCGVHSFWSEIKNLFKTQEFVEINSNKGIGVVFLP